MHNPYVYRLTDLVNGKRYIGSRYAKVCDPSDLGVSYFTSRPEVEKIGEKIASKRLNSIKYKCGCCDLTTTIGPLAYHQKASNHFGKNVI